MVGVLETREFEAEVVRLPPKIRDALLRLLRWAGIAARPFLFLVRGAVTAHDWLAAPG